MKIEKYHGLGNNFLLTDYKKGIDYKEVARKLCNQKISIGGDGLIVVKKEPLEMLIYNQDGSEAIMCGNGIRCFIHYSFYNGLLNKRRENIEVRTKSGIYIVSIVSLLPFITRVRFKRSLIRKEIIGIYNEEYESYFVKVGVNHNVIVRDENNKEKINKLKNDFNKYSGFCEETNINIVEKVNDNTIKVETYERGVGLTSNCGTGSVASSLVTNYLFDCLNNINVINEYGKISISILGNYVYMEGPSERICSIEVNYD